jgi:hypothetical protein
MRPAGVGVAIFGDWRQLSAKILQKLAPTFRKNSAKIGANFLRKFSKNWRQLSASKLSIFLNRFFLHT